MLVGFALLMLWGRIVRALLISPRFGRFIIMLIAMFAKDVVNFLVLATIIVVAFSMAALKMFEIEDGPAKLTKGGDAPLSEDAPFHWRRMSEDAPFHFTNLDCDTIFRSQWLTSLMIFEGAITGSDHFDCVGASAKPLASTFLFYLLYFISTLLLLNLLISAMAGSYAENDKLATQRFNDRFGNLVFELRDSHAAPVPLSLLTIIYETVEYVFQTVYHKSAHIIRRIGGTPVQPLVETEDEDAEELTKEEKENSIKKNIDSLKTFIKGKRSKEEHLHANVTDNVSNVEYIAEKVKKVEDIAESMIDKVKELEQKSVEQVRMLTALLKHSNVNVPTAETLAAEMKKMLFDPEKLPAPGKSEADTVGGGLSKANDDAASDDEGANADDSNEDVPSAANQDSDKDDSDSDDLMSWDDSDD